jgi:head-tail adaptor
MIGAGEYRHSVHVDRQKKEADGAGGTRSAWRRQWSAIPARVLPLKGGELVRDGRTKGEAFFEITIRANPTTLQIVPSDRLLNARTGVVYDVQHIADLKGDGRELLLTCRTTT